MILEGLRNFGGGGVAPPNPHPHWYATAFHCFEESRNMQIYIFILTEEKGFSTNSEVLTTVASSVKS